MSNISKQGIGALAWGVAWIKGRLQADVHANSAADSDMNADAEDNRQVKWVQEKRNVWRIVYAD